MRIFLAIAVLLSAQPGLATMAPKERNKPKQVKPRTRHHAGPIIINLQPIDEGGRVDFTFLLQFRAGDGTEFKQTFKFSAGTSAATIRDFLHQSIPTNWKMTPVGDFQLVIEGHKQSPVASWMLTSKGLAEKTKPTIQWDHNKK